jgi:hypothetical protein
MVRIAIENAKNLKPFVINCNKLRIECLNARHHQIRNVKLQIIL